MGAGGSNSILTMNEEFRNRVLQRDSNRCVLCGTKNQDLSGISSDGGLHVHHVIPEEVGGKDELQNCISVCKHCHDVLEYTQSSAFRHILCRLADTDIETAIVEAVEIPNVPDTIKRPIQIHTSLMPEIEADDRSVDEIVEAGLRAEQETVPIEKYKQMVEERDQLEAALQAEQARDAAQRVEEGMGR